MKDRLATVKEKIKSMPKTSVTDKILEDIDKKTKNKTVIK